MIALNRFKPVAFVLCLLPAAVLAWDFWGVTHNRPEALGANPIREAEIFTGLWTLRFLAITLAVTPVRELLGLGALAMVFVILFALSGPVGGILVVLLGLAGLLLRWPAAPPLVLLVVMWFLIFPGGLVQALIQARNGARRRMARRSGATT